MKYSLNNYAEALASAVANATDAPRRDAAVRNFAALLKKSGDDVHADKIIGATERLLRKKEGSHEIVLESARPLESRNFQALSVAFAGAKDLISPRVNPGLVAGVRIVMDGERELDISLKGKLDRMFPA